MAQPAESVSRVLRILSGPHAGAEMALRPGRYVIGKDQDCDIVLSDSSLMARHALLRIGDDSVVFEPMEGAALGADGPIDGRIPLTEFSPVLIGTTAFALGPEEGAWPEITLPKAEQSTGVVEAQSADEEAGQPVAAAVQRATAVDERAVEKASRIWRSPGLPLRGSSLIAVVGVGVVILASALLGLYTVEMSGHGKTATSGDQAPLSDQVTAIVAGLNLSDDLNVTKASRGGEEVVTVSGYVPTEDERRRLVSQLQQFSQRVQIQVWSTTLLQSSVQQALEGMQIPLQVTSVENGNVVLSGVLDGTTSIDSLQSNLKSDVPGIAKLTLQVATMPDAILWLRQYAQQKNIQTEYLTFKGNGALLTATGQLADSQRDGWDGVVKAFDSHFNNEISLLDQVTFAPAPTVKQEQEAVAHQEPPAKFDFVVRAINVGPPAYVTMGSGEKYLVGSRLSNGMILHGVESDGMILIDGEKRHMVRVASNSGRVSQVIELPPQ